MFYISLCAAPGDRHAIEMLAARLDTFDGLVEWRVGRGATVPSLVIYLFNDPNTLRDAMRLRMRGRTGAFELFINIGEPLMRRPPGLLVCQASPGQLRQTLETIASVCFHGTFARGILPFSVSAIRTLFESEGWLETHHYPGNSFFQTEPDDPDRPAPLHDLEPVHAYCAMTHAPTKRRKPNYAQVIMAFGAQVGQSCTPHFAFTFRSSDTYVDTLAVFPAPTAPVIPPPLDLSFREYARELTEAQ
ncbi:hypothetical protein [Imbroritus primus]|uniref:hypothetical protein n=1 Tax=Imbroritus primus TaxID=3058603 RepID=UPI003D160E57